MLQHTYALLIILMAASALVPESIGVVGVGTISSAAVRGLCRSDAQRVVSGTTEPERRPPSTES